MKSMTWNDLYKALCKQCSRDALADNIIGHLMDDYESYDWNSVIPDGADSVLY